MILSFVKTGIWRKVIRLKTCPQGDLQAQNSPLNSWMYEFWICTYFKKLLLQEIDQLSDMNFWSQEDCLLISGKSMFQAFSSAFLEWYLFSYRLMLPMQEWDWVWLHSWPWSVFLEVQGKCLLLGFLQITLIALLTVPVLLNDLV